MGTWAFSEEMEDRKRLIGVMRKGFLHVLSVEAWMEQQDIHWQEHRGYVEGWVIQSLKAHRKDTGFLGKWKQLESQRASSIDFGESLWSAFITHLEENKSWLRAHVLHWDWDRLSFYDRALLLMSLAERKIMGHTVQASVGLNEYIEISKRYGSPKSSSFANGVLAKAYEIIK